MLYSDGMFKAAVVVALILGGIVFYRTMHPATVFAADGTDAKWDAAAKQAHDQGRPTVVLFTADWCPACRALHANALAREDVQQEFIGHYSFHTVDLTNPTPAAQAHARQLGVRYIPLMIRYDADGKETGRGNFSDPAALIAWLKEGE